MGNVFSEWSDYTISRWNFSLKILLDIDLNVCYLFSQQGSMMPSWISKTHLPAHVIPILITKFNIVLIASDDRGNTSCNSKQVTQLSQKLRFSD